MKKPKGWRPGKTPKFKPHPSVVRYREPEVRTWINIGIQDGATHVRFVAHPDCCDICQRLDGRVQRIETVDRWMYTTAHCNCRCSWQPGYMVRGEFVTEKGDGVGIETLDGVTEMSEFSFTHDPLEVSQRFFVKARNGLVKKKVPVKRDGKIIMQERWVKPGDGASIVDPKEARRRIPKEMPKRVPKEMPKIPDHVEKQLSSIQAKIDALATGKTTAVNGVPVTPLKDGFYGVEMAGKKMVVRGSHAASVVIDYAGRAGVSAGSLMVGDVSGQGAAGAQGVGDGAAAMVRQKGQKAGASIDKKSAERREEKRKDDERKAQAEKE